MNIQPHLSAERVLRYFAEFGVHPPNAVSDPGLGKLFSMHYYREMPTRRQLLTPQPLHS